MYFLSKLFRNFRYLISLIGIGSGLVIIIFGALSGGTAFIVGGSLCILPGGLIFFEEDQTIKD